MLDYKWETYARDFFMFKLKIYVIFMMFFYWDVEVQNDPERVKGISFIFTKVVCFSINFYFLSYEITQMINEGFEYLKDMWNYWEVSGILWYFIGSCMDIVSDEITDTIKILYVFSNIFSLIKLLYLIRVFKQLSFLVMMVIQVMIDVKFFFILFFIFLLSFAICYRIVDVDVSYYGRV